MGFGTLIFGYFLLFAFTLSNIYFFADIVGALIVIWAFSKLAEYNRWFNYAMASTLALLLLCGAAASNLIIPWYSQEGAVKLAIDFLKLIAAAALHVFFFLGTAGICQGADAQPLVKKTKRDFIATMIYYGISLIVAVLGVFMSGTWMNEIGAALIIYWFLCLFLNLALIYQCFGILIPAEGEAEKKRSKIPLFRFLDEKFDELDDKRNAYRKESMKMAMEEAERRAGEKAKKKKKKK